MSFMIMLLKNQTRLRRKFLSKKRLPKSYKVKLMALFRSLRPSMLNLWLHRSSFRGLKQILNLCKMVGRLRSLQQRLKVLKSMILRLVASLKILKIKCSWNFCKRKRSRISGYSKRPRIITRKIWPHIIAV